MDSSLKKWLTVAVTNNRVQSRLPQPGLPLCSFPPISYLLCSCLSHCHGCLIIQALCHKAAENPISHLLMASAFSLSYSNIMSQAQRAPHSLPMNVLWVGNELRSSAHWLFSGEKHCLSVEGRVWWNLIWNFNVSFLSLTLMLHFFTSQFVHLLFFAVVTVFFFLSSILIMFHSLPPIHWHCMSHGLILCWIACPLCECCPLNVTRNLHALYTDGKRAPCGESLHYKSSLTQNVPFVIKLIICTVTSLYY